MNFVMDAPHTNGNSKTPPAIEEKAPVTGSEVKNVSTPTPQTPVQNWLASNLLTLVISLVTLAVTFAYMQGKVERNADEIKELKGELHRISDELRKDGNDKFAWQASTQNKLSKVEGLVEGLLKAFPNGEQQQIRQQQQQYREYNEERQNQR